MSQGIVPWDGGEFDERAMIAGVRFPVFAAQGLPLELGGWGESETGEIDMVSVRHRLDDDRWIDVESAVEEDGYGEIDAAGDAAERLGVDAALPEATPLRVDGVDVPFAIAVSGDRWAAVGIAGDVLITVEARGIGTRAVMLRAVADPAALLDEGIPEYRPPRREHDVLDPHRIVELAASTPIEDLGPALAGHARGALALLVSGEPQRSWLGGEPELPPGERRPEGAHGAMAFVAQLSLADLDPAVWPGPTEGVLHVFCDIEPESRSIDGAGACGILHTPPGAELRPCPAPAGLHENTRIPRHFVVPRAGLTVPDADATPMRPYGLGFTGAREADAHHLWRLAEHLHAEQGWHRRAGQLLGWPTWQHDDATPYLASLRDGQALEWTLLVQTDVLGPELYVMLPAVDLADGRFDRAEAIVEHD